MRRFHIISAFLVFIFVVQIHHVALAHIMDEENTMMMPCGGAGIPLGMPSDGCVCCVLQQADKNSSATGIYRIPLPLPILPTFRATISPLTQEKGEWNAAWTSVSSLEKNPWLKTVVQRK